MAHFFVVFEMWTFFPFRCGWFVSRCHFSLAGTKELLRRILLQMMHCSSECFALQLSIHPKEKIHCISTFYIFTFDPVTSRCLLLVHQYKNHLPLHLCPKMNKIEKSDSNLTQFVHRKPNSNILIFLLTKLRWRASSWISSVPDDKVSVELELEFPHSILKPTHLELVIYGVSNFFQ